MQKKTTENGRPPIDLDPEEFRKIGHEVVDRIADLFGTLGSGPVTSALKPSGVRALLGEGSLPAGPAPAGDIVRAITDQLFSHSLYNGHPRFWGYITSSPAPIGALGDFLAAAVNPNVGSFRLSPVATEVEAQSLRWIAELIGFPADSGGILVTGGNMANFVCFLAGRNARSGRNIQREGTGGGGKLRVYVSSETHTWINKATDISGLGTDSIRWIPADADQKMSLAALEQAIVDDRAAGDQPMMVVGTAGSVSTGAVDPLRSIADIAKKHGLWFHVDGAYGAFAAALPEASADLRALSAADSIAVDPHKWLYTPLECGCALVRDRALLRDTFHYHPEYYRFSGEPDDAPTNFFEYGPQNSRGFRALKVWLGIRQAGRDGIVAMIRRDISLAGEMHRALASHAEIQTFTVGLSIVTFRYAPPGLRGGTPGDEERLNALNSELLERIQDGGEAFVSNAVIDGKTLLRACIVNFRTTLEDVRALPGIVARHGREILGETGAGGR
jgi:aromatic-L-amino-acid decarboxylase